MIYMLKQELDNLSKDMGGKAPEEVKKVMQESMQKLINSKIDEKSLKKGDNAPEFSLLNINNELISSKTFLQKGPLIVNFYRGSWCPFCNLEIAEWQRLYSKIKEVGADLISISPNLQSSATDTKNKHNVDFEILSDKENKIAKLFGLVFTLPEELRPIYKQFGINIPEANGDESYELPIPATYVIDKGKIIYSFVEIDYKKRAEPSDVVKLISNS